MDVSNIEDYFPQGLAKGDAFLGRENDIKWLSDNILSNHHTLLLAPRRYGKTSLALNTIHKIKIDYEEIDLHLAVSAKSVENKILNAISSILRKISKKNERILEVVQDFFKGKKLKWTLGFKGVLGIEIEPEKKDDVPENILIALKLLDHVLIKNNKKAVLFIDEFQEIHDLDEGRQVQGAIRNFAQSSKNLTLIFSGSNRKMLLSMFDDKSQPMYELCDRIILQRISSGIYEKYINRIARKTWGESLSKIALEKIFELSQLHPKRIYNLCYYTWRMCSDKKTVPEAVDVQNAWDYFANQRVKDLRYNLSSISAGQVKLLIIIACEKATELTGKTSQDLTKMASSSITKALNKLEENDYIERDEIGKYRLIDPLIEYVLVKYESNNL